MEAEGTVMTTAVYLLLLLCLLLAEAERKTLIVALNVEGMDP